MSVSACLVTRGDVDMRPVLDSLPSEWEVVIWDNGEETIRFYEPVTRREDFAPCADLAVYGRYAAIEYASHDLIYVADDDVIVSDPQAIVDTFIHTRDFCAICKKPMTRQETPSGHVVWACEEKHCVLDEVVCNMPPEFRPHYPDSALVGFGACFHRDAPRRAFGKWEMVGAHTIPSDLFNRRADNIFTVLTPRVLVDVPKQDREMASDPNRMWRQPGHEAEKQRMIELARRVRDA